MCFSPLYIPQVPARFNMAQNSRTRDDMQATSGSSSGQTGASSRVFQSLSAHHSRQSYAKNQNAPTTIGEDGDEANPQHYSNLGVSNNRFSRHSLVNKSPYIEPVLKPKQIPDIDPNSNLLKLPAYMTANRGKQNENFNAKAIPLIATDSNLIKPTAASKSKSQNNLNDPDSTGEAWGKLKLTPGQALQPQVPPPPPLPQPREKEKPAIPPKISAHIEMSKFAHRVNTLSVADFAALRRMQRIGHPRRQTLLLAATGHKERPSKSFSVIESSLVRNANPLFLASEEFSHFVENSQPNTTMLHTFGEAPKVVSKKSLPLKLLEPRYRYRVPSRAEVFNNEKPVYFLAPVRTVLPFER